MSVLFFIKNNKKKPPGDFAHSATEFQFSCQVYPVATMQGQANKGKEGIFPFKSKVLQCPGGLLP
jgi:hypothetical protein